MFGRKKHEAADSGYLKKGKPEKVLREIEPLKRKRSKKFILLYIAGFAFIVYASYTIISHSVQLSESRARLAELNHQIKILEIQNESLDKVKKYKGDELNEYIENIAREDLDYVKNGERVFINISGD